MSADRGARRRWLLVVQPDQPELFELLRARLEGSDVEVLLERRQRERRRESLGPAMERRITDRRRRRAVAAVTPATPGAPPRGGAAGDPAAPAAPSAPRVGPLLPQCPTCQGLLEVELPRFPQPPARLELHVRHEAGDGRVPRHSVEIAAFTVSGRILLSQRVPARLRG
jgi:hypothetical protein